MRGTLTVTPQSTPQPSAHGASPAAPPNVQEANDTRRAARSQRKTATMMLRAEQGAQRLRARGNAPAPQAPTAHAVVVVPTSAEDFRRAVGQLFPAAGNAADREALIARLAPLGALPEDTSVTTGRYIRPILAAQALAAGSAGSAADALRVLRHIEQTVRFDSASFHPASSEAHSPSSTRSTNSSTFGLGHMFDEGSAPASSRHSNASDLRLSHLFQDSEVSPRGSGGSLNRHIEQGSPQALSRTSSLSVQYGSEAASVSSTLAPTIQPLKQPLKQPLQQPLSEACAIAAAWRTAQLLSRTHHGFETLSNLMHEPPTPELVQTARTFLQAADHLHPNTTTASDPAALLHAHAPSGDPRAESFAVTVLHAAACRLRGEAVSPPQVGALFAWRQGFREDGPGSDLANTKARLAKFVGRSIPRVEKQGTRSHFWQMIGKKKSPLSAAALGVHGADRAGLVKEMDTYTGALRTLIDTLATAGDAATTPRIAHPGDLWRTAILRHWQALAADNAPLSAYALTPEILRALQRQVGASVDRLQHEMSAPTAIARTAGSSPAHQEFAQLVTQAGLTDDAQSEVWAQGRLRNLAMPQVISAQARFAQLVNHAGLVGEPPAYLVGLQPSASLLRYWGGYAEEAASSPAFGTALEAAGKLEHHNDLKLQTPTIEGARQTIETLIKSMESSNKVRLANGGWIGLSTSGVSTGLSHVGKALPVPVSVQLDANIGTSRHAVVEIGRSTHGRDLFLGTDRAVRGSLGVGASVGYDIKSKHLGHRLRLALFGLKFTPVDMESSTPRGVMIRTPRPTIRPIQGHDDWEVIKYDDKRAEQTQLAVTNLLFEHAAASRDHRPEPDALWNALAQYGDDSTGISVGWVDQTKRRSRAAMEVSTGINVRVTSKATPFRIGPSARLRAEKTISNTAATLETAGTLRIEQFSVSTSHKITARAGVAFSVGDTFNTASPNDNASSKAGERGKITQSFTGGMPLSYNWKLAEGGHTTKVKMVYHNGKIADRVCYFDTEYRSAKEYLAVVRSERDAWVQMLAHKPGGALGKATREFEAYCETVEKHARPNQRYLHRHRLRPATARQIEGHLDLADLHRSIDPNSANVQASEALAQALLHAPESRLPEKLAIVEQVSTSSSLGLTMAVQMRSNSAAEGTRELAAIKFG
ncbi:hypothetical protein [Ralstonia sp. A12]|uniref:hypothetical protein n=1 Tax=Ralstonia sp. A12 TaxID=1217052 RepID=UPI000694B22B|nr:hypothetical protein [Ralstonia sp. A12]